MATYDPSKQYVWNVDEKFELSGIEFSTILNATRAILNSPEAQRIMALARGHEVIEEMMRKGVEAGKIREAGTEVPAPKPVMAPNKEE